MSSAVASSACASAGFMGKLQRSRDALLALALEHARAPGTSGQRATVTQLLDHSRRPATVAWLGDEPLQVGRTYWAVHGHRRVKARGTRIVQHLDVHTLERETAGAALLH